MRRPFSIAKKISEGLCIEFMDGEEFERYEPKGDFPPKEPHEPFFPDEMLEPSHEAESPSLAGLHVPQVPITKEKLATFLIELEPIVEGIQQISRKDQHLVATRLQEVKNTLHTQDFSEEIVHLFEKITDHFNDLLTHSTPLDQKAVLSDISQLQGLI